MSGSKRKSSYRKSVIDEYKSNEVELPLTDDIVKVRSCRGSNVFEVETITSAIHLALLPNKFNKLIWIKRNDFLLVQSSDEVNDSNTLPQIDGKLKYIVKQILSKDQIKYLKSQNYWPSSFALDDSTCSTDIQADTSNCIKYKNDDLMPGYESEEFGYEE